MSCRSWRALPAICHHPDFTIDRSETDLPSHSVAHSLRASLAAKTIRFRRTVGPSPVDRVGTSFPALAGCTRDQRPVPVRSLSEDGFLSRSRAPGGLRFPSGREALRPHSPDRIRNPVPPSAARRPSEEDPCAKEANGGFRSRTAERSCCHS
jgi:hypothetical protein